MLACLGMLGPFAIDTYLPAFPPASRDSIGARRRDASKLSSYLFGFAVMNMFHGALSDSLGPRPVVLWGVALFTLASAGCALSNSIACLVFFRACRVCPPRRHGRLAGHHPRHVPPAEAQTGDVRR